MLKKLLIGTTFAAAALAGTPLLADTGHGQRAQCIGTNCPAATAEQHGQHGMSHGGMRGRMQAMHGGHGTQRGNQGEGCPMHGERKPA